MNKKDPLIRIAKRSNALLAKKYVWMIRVGALVLALIIGAILYAALGNNPIEAYGYLISGSLAKSLGRKQVLRNMVPLLGTALALAPCFKMKYWNIGAEGQITIGAMTATYFALNFADKLPAFPLLLIMALAGMLAGGIWSAIPAFFKAKWGTNETLFTLMLNYIAIGIVAWLQGGPWEGRPGTQQIPQFAENACLPSVFGVHIGWIIIFVLVFVMYVYMKYTKQGYEIAVLGESENTARYAGMNVGKIIIRTAAISGAISGLVGFLLASGANTSLQSTIANGAGFTAITVCWLSQLNPFAMIVISFMLAVLSKGSSTVQTKLGVPSSMADIITGVILLCMLGCEFFINYKVYFRQPKKAVKEVE